MRHDGRLALRLGRGEFEGPRLDFPAQNDVTSALLIVRSAFRTEGAPGAYYSDVGRPSIDPELMIRMLIVGYSFGIRSERRLCDEVHLNLAYRWFRRLGLDGDVPDHSTFSKNRHGRFRESDLLRKLFETVVGRCMKEGVVGAKPSRSTPV